MQAEILNGFRLSPQQELLWPFQKTDQSYRAQCAVLIEGDLNTNLLGEALTGIVLRHEILRTVYNCRPGMTLPFQVVTDDIRFSWSESDRSVKQQDQAIEQSLKSEARFEFDLERGPVLRCALLKLANDSHLLTISLPSISADACTLDILIREIAAQYQACAEGRELAGEPLQYADYSEWQKELLESAEGADGKTYWRKQFDNSPAQLKLPFDSHVLKTDFEQNLPDQILEPDLMEMAKKFDVPFSTFAFACWQALLWHITGTDDFLIGHRFDAREFEELRSGAGLYAKWLPIRCLIDRQMSFRDLLGQTCEALQNAGKWQDYYPPADLYDVNRLSVITAGFEYDERPATFSSAGLRYTLQQREVCTAPFALKLSIIEEGESSRFRLRYDSTAFSPDTIAYVSEQYLALLKSVIRNPETAVGRLDVMTESQQRQVVVEFNDTRVDFGEGHCIHKLFEEHAACSPDQIAVIYEGQHLSYGGLNRKANQIARHLQTLNVGPDVPVAIMLDRSADTIAAMLATLKAGGAYLPLDIAQPKARLASMIDEARPAVVITRQEFVGNLHDHQMQTVCLDTDCESIIRNSSDNLPGESTGENLVYMLFTSGSTGKPKAVAVEHRQLYAYTQAILQRLNLPPGASYATVSTFSADLGNTVIFPALSTGGCLHIISNERAFDAEKFSDYLRYNWVDCLKIVPSHLEALQTCCDASELLPRKRLILGGEPSGWDWVEHMQGLTPDCSILNHYGPTETTVGVLTHEVRIRPDATRRSMLPLGRPIPNAAIYMLNAHLDPVPLSVTGEIYIGGPNVARGYVNQPDVTAYRFLPNPFGKESGERIYRTGDLGRFLPDGIVEFLGRLDQQVKVRGYRIELGEIDAVAERHPAVKEAVTVVRESESGNKSLATYIVPAQRQWTDVEELQRYLTDQLPDYMIPGIIVRLEKMPLTANGKVDRRALPDPAYIEVSGRASYVEPRNAVEEVVVRIWEEVLGVEKIGINDNFIMMGGHSLAAMQVLARLRKTFQIGVPVRVLFEARNVAELVEAMSAEERIPGRLEKIARVVKKIEQMGEEDVNRLLEDRRRDGASA
ncbi:MAG: amino acid adenylation domain-containing protein [Blastocatellia bacterium]